MKRYSSKYKSKKTAYKAKYKSKKAAYKAKYKSKKTAYKSKMRRVSGTNSSAVQSTVQAATAHPYVQAIVNPFVVSGVRIPDDSNARTFTISQTASTTMFGGTNNGVGGSGPVVQGIALRPSMNDGTFRDIPGTLPTALPRCDAFLSVIRDVGENYQFASNDLFPSLFGVGFSYNWGTIGYGDPKLSWVGGPAGYARGQGSRARPVAWGIRIKHMGLQTAINNISPYGKLYWGVRNTENDDDAANQSTTIDTQMLQQQVDQHAMFTQSGQCNTNIDFSKIDDFATKGLIGCCTVQEFKDMPNGIVVASGPIGPEQRAFRDIDYWLGRDRCYWYDAAALNLPTTAEGERPVLAEGEQYLQLDGKSLASPEDIDSGNVHLTLVRKMYGPAAFLLNGPQPWFFMKAGTNVVLQVDCIIHWEVIPGTDAYTLPGTLKTSSHSPQAITWGQRLANLAGNVASAAAGQLESAAAGPAIADAPRGESGNERVDDVVAGEAMGPHQEPIEQAGEEVDLDDDEIPPWGNNGEQFADEHPNGFGFPVDPMDADTELDVPIETSVEIDAYGRPKARDVNRWETDPKPGTGQTPDRPSKPKPGDSDYRYPDGSRTGKAGRRPPSAGDPTSTKAPRKQPHPQRHVTKTVSFSPTPLPSRKPEPSEDYGEAPGGLKGLPPGKPYETPGGLKGLPKASGWKGAPLTESQIRQKQRNQQLALYQQAGYHSYKPLSATATPLPHRKHPVTLRAPSWFEDMTRFDPDAEPTPSDEIMSLRGSRLRGSYHPDLTVAPPAKRSRGQFQPGMSYDEWSGDQVMAEYEPGGLRGLPSRAKSALSQAVDSIKEAYPEEVHLFGTALGAAGQSLSEAAKREALSWVVYNLGVREAAFWLMAQARTALNTAMSVPFMQRNLPQAVRAAANAAAAARGNGRRRR